MEAKDPESGFNEQDTAAAMSKTTTISTIAVQSGKTRIVIALLHCGDFINLKILEVTPELTTLGNTLEEALKLQKAHDDVLRQLQNKQSPVEELLRQADQLIATQKPRAEVYAAMAESLGKAWRDINNLLELRKIILDLNVQYHERADEFFKRNEELDKLCSDTVVPIDIETVKSFLTTIHDLRRTLLENLMIALQAGNNLLAKLRELGVEGTLDSRPDRIRISVNRAIAQVQEWMDQLHIKRQILEVTFTKRKAQLEQCLALALLAADLKELEDIIQNRREVLANSNQFGDSSSSSELLLHEHKKLLPEAQQLQERALKITKATEQLVASGCFAGEEATQQSYVVLSATSDYLSDLQSKESLLSRIIQFFRSAQTVLNKLDQLEIQLTTTELQRTSPQLAQLHLQCSKAIEEATSSPIAEGYAILDLTGRGSGTEGIKQMVEELENKKIALDSLCIAHKEENIRINQALNNFLEKHNDIYTWLVTIAEAFLQRHQDLGNDLNSAQDFLELHNRLLGDLQIKGNEINALLLTLPPILEYLEDAQRKDVDKKVEGLHDRWMKLKNVLENRLDLARIFLKFFMEADIVNNEMNALENVVKETKGSISEESERIIQEKFENLIPLYQSAKNTGLTFISESNRDQPETHLDLQRARRCVNSVLESLSNRQLVVHRSWQSTKEDIVEKRELLVRFEVAMAEAMRTVNWVSKLDSQLYPVIATASNKPKEISTFLERKLESTIPDIRKAQSEVEQRVKIAESLLTQTNSTDEKSHHIISKLHELNQKLLDTSSEYQILLQVLIGYFKNLEEIDTKSEQLNIQMEKTGYPKDIHLVENVLKEHELSRETILERFRFAQSECEQIAQRIKKQEPSQPAEEDINKLQHVLELRRSEFENQWRQRHESIKSHEKFCNFESELNEINTSLTTIEKSVRDAKMHYGDSLLSAKNVAKSFEEHEHNIRILDDRIESFVRTSELLVLESSHTLPHRIQSEISELQDRWNNLKNNIEQTKQNIELATQYWNLVEQADDWFKEGSKLLVTIARKSTSVKHPEEAHRLLDEITRFLLPGEEQQHQRIQRISQLALEIYGPDHSKYAPIISQNKEMLESFASIIDELTALSSNLIAAEEEKQRLLKEQEEIRKAEEIRRIEETRLIQQRIQAEEARIVHESRLADERRRAEEARIADDKHKAELARLEAEKLAEQARLEAERLANERRQAELARQQEEAKILEERRKAEEERRRAEEAARLAEEKRLAEELRLAEERRLAEEARIAEERRRAEEERLAAERRRAEEARLAEERHKAELARLEAERLAEAARLEEERTRANSRMEEERIRAEIAKLEEAKRLAELERIEEDKRRAEQARLDEERRLAELARIEEERRKAEQARLEDEKRREQARLEEERERAKQAKIDAEKRAAELAKIEDERRKAEQARIEDEKRREQARLEEERRRAEQARIDEEQRLAELAKIEEERRKVEQARREDEIRREKLRLQEEQERAERARLDEERRQAELAKIEAERKKVEQARLEDEKRREKLRLQEEQERAERARLDDERRQAELAKIEAERKKVEQARLEEEKRREQARLQEEKDRAERARLDEERRLAELAKIDEERRKVEQAKRDEEIRREKARIEEERQRAEQARIDQEKRLAELAKIEEERHKVEQARLEEERRREIARIQDEHERAERARLDEEKRLAELAKIEDEKRKVEQARLEEEVRLRQLRMQEEHERAERARIEEEKRMAELAKIEEERRRVEQARLEEEKRLHQLRIQEEQERAQRAKLDEEKRLAELAKIEEEKRKVEQARLQEEQDRAQRAKLDEQKRQAELAKIEEEKRKVEQARIEEEKRREQARILEEEARAQRAKLDEEKRLAELAKIEEEKRKVQQARIEEEKRREQARLQEDQERAQRAKLDEEKRLAELAKIEDEKRKVEQARIEEEKRRQQARLQEEQERAQRAKLDEEQRLAELAKIEEEKRKVEQARIEEEKRREQARIHDDEERAQRARLDEEKRLAELAKIEEEKRKVEQARIEEEKRREQARLQEEQERAQRAKLDEEKRLAELAKIEDEKRKVEQARIEEEKRREQARIQEEQERAQRAKLDEEKRQAELAKIEDERKKIEQARIDEERRRQQAVLEQQRKEEEERQRAKEAARIEEEHKRILEEQRIKQEKQSKVVITEITEVHKIDSIDRQKSPLIEEANEAPVFISPLSDAIIQEGSKFKFICQVIGNPTPNVTWYKAGIAIENNPDYHTTFKDGLCELTIEETFAEDSAKYTCVATNTVGSAETEAMLSVKETEPEEQLTPPTFVKLLQPGSAKEGSSFSFECKVEGYPLPTIQWYKNGECVDNNPDYIITYNNGDAVLKLDKVELHDKAEYSCKASNEMGTAQSTANLVVTPLEPAEAPQFILPLSNVMARAGQKIKLECEVSGVPLPILSWTQNDKPVKETRELKLQLEGTKATLVILEAFPKDAGTFSVKASNIAGEATSTCQVTVKGRLPTETSDSEMASDLEPIKPSVQLPLTDVSVKEGDRVRLDCVIIGQPEPEVIWYHDERPVKESPDFQLLFQGDRCSLIIQEALPEDAGEYKVVALNSAGEASSKCSLSVVASTEVKPPEEKPEEGSAPKFVKLLADVLVSESDKVLLEGNVVGQPRPDVKWLLNNVPISEDNTHFVTTYDEEGNIKLEITNVRPEDKGVYTVKASNKLGDAKCFSQLIVKSSKPLDSIIHEEKKEAPVFKELFNDRVAFQETSTKFECIVTGKPTPKVKWLFNGNPISGKDFLISTSGDRQVLSIENIKPEHQGTITCVAENEAGKASCAASLSVQTSSQIILEESKIPQIESQVTKQIESSYKVNREVTSQSSSSQSSKIISSSFENRAQPHVEEHKVVSQNVQRCVKINEGAPDIKESRKYEEYHKIGDSAPLIHEKSYSSHTIGETKDIQQQSKTIQHQEIIKRPVKVVRPPKFVTPVIGKIVDQDVNVLLEGILDGQPTPNVSWTKNGTPLIESDKLKIKFELNKVSVEIKNATVEDAGRYSCTATNEAGTAVSTADLVVRKTIFPPVFGRRLQAQVIKKGDRVIMEVEVTGTPEPTITWFKDGTPIVTESNVYRIKAMGQSHTLVIDKADLSHTGRYMVRATNAGGEAQSIADIAVFEPTPETMMEVVKTVVYEDVRKQETLTSAADKVSSISTQKSSFQQPSLASKIEIPKVEIPSSTLFNIPSQSSSEYIKTMSSKKEISKVEEQQLSQQVQTYKLEHKMPDIPSPKPIEPRKEHVVEKQSDYQFVRPDGGIQKEVIEEKRTETKDEGIETSSISKQSSLQYFVKKINEADAPPSVPKEASSIPTQIKPDVYQKFVPSQAVSIIETKSSSSGPNVQEFKSYSSSSQSYHQESKSFSSKIESSSSGGTKQEFKSYSSQVVEPPQAHQTFSSSSEKVSTSFGAPKIIPQPPQQYQTYSSVVDRKSTQSQSKPFTQEFKSYSSQTISQPHVYQTFSSDIKREFDIKPEAPAQICYPKPQEYSSSSFSKTEEKKEQSSSFQTSSSSYSYESTKKQETERPSSAASSYYSAASEKAFSRPTSAQSGHLEPSQEGLLMEKQWAHRFSESKLEKSWPPQQQEIKPTWSVQSTLEKKWTPSSQVKSESVLKKTEIIDRTPALVLDATPVQHYIGEVEHLGTLVKEHATLDSTFETKSEIIEERNVKPSEVIKSWPPAQEYVPPPQKKVVEYPHVRPVSVPLPEQEIYLEPGSPPIIDFAEPPKERRQSYVEVVEQKIAQDFQKVPQKVPPCAVAVPPRIPVVEKVIPPPLPPKREILVAPPLPAKPKKVVEVPSLPFERFRDLEPFPFKPDPERPRPMRVGPPPTPSKFIKGRFTDSDYESDFEAVRIPPRWKPSMSDTEEPQYRRVRAPILRSSGRSRSQEPEPLPPSRFDHIPSFQGPPRPEINFEECRKKKQASEIKKFTKHYEQLRREASPPKIKPASPPVYVQAEVKPSSPKLKKKFVQDGYMADTDEPFVQRVVKSTEYSMESRQLSSSSEKYESSSQRVVSQPKSRPSKRHQVVSSSKKELVSTPIITTQSTYHEEHEKNIENLEPFPYTAEPSKPKPRKVPPPPSPSKFVKGEFKGSDYESDYEGRIPPVWGDGNDKYYRPVRPVLTPTQHHSRPGRTPTPPTEFEVPPQNVGALRPKFEPIEKVKPGICKPMAVVPVVLQPGSPPEIGYAPGPKKTQYYRSSVSAPFHNAIQTETSNVVHLDESTENCHRTMSVQQTHKVIRFGENKYESRRSTSVPPAPTPTKFIPGEFRESDYESEVESTRIKSKWAPSGTSDNIAYRRVQAPHTGSSIRSSSVPGQRVETPMEFDRTGPLMPSKISSTVDTVDSSYKQIAKRSHSYEAPSVLHPGTPPEYGYAPSRVITKKSATQLASHHMDSMTKEFKSKTQQFVKDVISDREKSHQQKPILKSGQDGDAQVYREETRASERGTKHVDPDTGLIYFKYDFGYEFGIILPGESKKGEIPTPKKTIIEPPKRNVDIEMPVYHENSTQNLAPTPQFKPKKFASKPWDPTSESEISESEDGKKRGVRWEQSSCSPVSISPSLPSTSPAFNNYLGKKGNETPPSRPSTPGSTTPGRILHSGQARAPMFITPLRDIAVVAGQAAKFECIVQSEPPSNVLWSKNGRIIEDSNDYQIHYRNGVCRLTISQAYPEDAGTYICTASNQAGTANTTATLQVPGERRSQYI